MCIRHSLLLCLFVCVQLGPVANARAEVTEPNGIVVPLTSLGGEAQLSDLFAARGEAIDFIADGSPKPDVFSPLCGFTATFVLKESGSSLGVGWYNAGAQNSVAPTAAEITEILAAGSPVGTVVTGADIRQHPNYAGGSIGFALLRSPAYFTETRFNPVCTLCTSPGPWVLSVTYPSTLADNAFYVAFEDGNANTFTWSNDGDFNDYVFYFEGLSCLDEGDSCEVEQAVGECVPGILECLAEGTTVCKALTEAGPEACDALDNDCDGSTDEGTDLCPGAEVCSRGRCVPRCGNEEFVCTVPPFTACEKGLCVEPQCVGKQCPSGETCIQGECMTPCDGILCPGSQQCRAGVCVDACEGVTCDNGRVCRGGACILHCDCAGCDGNLECNSATGQCVVSGCENTQCPPGTACDAGGCIDPCQNAVCPAGTQCTDGQCETAETPGNEPTGGTDSPGSAGRLDSGTGGQPEAPSTAGVQPTGGSIAGGVLAGGGQPSAPVIRDNDDIAGGGCGCSLSPRQGDFNGAATWLLIPGLLWLSRRPRRP